MAFSKNSNPFFDEEDEEDCSFEKKENIQEQIFASEDRQLDSTMRALRSIQESEIMGVATAEVNYCWYPQIEREKDPEIMHVIKPEKERGEKERGREREREINNALEPEREKEREIAEEFHFILECDAFKC